MCNTCNESINIPVGPVGPEGPQGPPGEGADLIVKDAQGHTVTGVNEIRFTDANALVSTPIGGVAEVKFTPTATTWMDIMNLPYYVAGSESFRPQYTIEGNKITFRGMLYIPLSGAPNISNGNSYLSISGAGLDETKMSIVTNANSNNGGPQGRFFTTNVGALPNFPINAIPQDRDITFTNVPLYRRHLGSRLTIYRSYVQLTIGSLNTIFKNGVVFGIGCISVYSPYASEYAGDGTPPLGNDPLALSITNVTVEQPADGYIAATDNFPFTIPTASANNPFTCDAHNISNLGGFIINLEGLSGYLN